MTQDILDELLKVGRRKLPYRYIGRIEKIRSESKIKPLVAADSHESDLEGFASGNRSGLFNISEEWFKIKGCSVNNALKRKGTYTDSYNLVSPYGGFLESRARREVEITNRYNEIMKSEGFAFPHEPEAIIHYEKNYRPNFFSQFITTVGMIFYPRIHRYAVFPFFGKEELVGSVMKIKGDIRLPEISLYRGLWSEKGKYLSNNIITKLGMLAGSQMKLLKGKIYWDSKTSAHKENYIIFKEHGHLHIGMVDFEVSSIHCSDSGHRSNLRALEKSLSKNTMDHWFSEGGLFLEGFKKGYLKPDMIRSIPLDNLN